MADEANSKQETDIEESIPFLTRLKDTISEFLSKASKRSGDYLYTPDKNDPSTWKLPVHDLRHMGDAAAALSSGGFRGNPVELPAGVKAKLRAKLRAMYERMGKEPPESLKKEAPLTVFKDDNGQWHWLARYSNNFRDNDHPAEIISKESHMNFVSMVDSGEAEMPELWHWHTPGTAWGKAEWVAYDEDNGIAMAAGIVLPGHEKEAENLENYDGDIGVSHGMPTESVARDPQDNTIIIRHITKEISDLPLWAAANKLTSFYVFKETDMSIPDKKKPYLQEIMGEEGVKELENANAQTKQVAEDQNIESKEETPEVVDEKAKTEGKKPCTKKADGTEDCVDEEMVEAKKEETPSAETQPSETKEEPAKVEANLVSAEQLAEVVTAFTKGLNDAVEALNAKIESIRTEVKEAKEKSAVDTTNPVIPTASLAAIIATGLRGVGNEDNRVKKSETLAKSGPEETPANESAQARYGNPVVDSVIRGITGEK